MKQTVLATVLTLVGLLAARSLFAHHSPTAIFDMSKKAIVTGTLTEVDWFNPHIRVAVDAKGPDGSTEAWKFESNPPSWFKRVGLSRADVAKAIGQTVTVEGVRARDGSRYGYMLKITFTDGNSYELVLSGQESKP